MVCYHCTNSPCARRCHRARNHNRGDFLLVKACLFVSAGAFAVTSRSPAMLRLLDKIWSPGLPGRVTLSLVTALVSQFSRSNQITPARSTQRHKICGNSANRKMGRALLPRPYAWKESRSNRRWPQLAAQSAGYTFRLTVRTLCGNAYVSCAGHTIVRRMLWVFRVFRAPSRKQAVIDCNDP